jgi:hypothetical protein
MRSVHVRAVNVTDPAACRRQFAPVIMNQEPPNPPLTISAVVQTACKVTQLAFDRPQVSRR